MVLGWFFALSPLHHGARASPAPATPATAPSDAIQFQPLTSDSPLAPPSLDARPRLDYDRAWGNDPDKQRAENRTLLVDKLSAQVTINQRPMTAPQVAAPTSTTPEPLSLTGLQWSQPRALGASAPDEKPALPARPEALNGCSSWLYNPSLEDGAGWYQYAPYAFLDYAAYYTWPNSVVMTESVSGDGYPASGPDMDAFGQNFYFPAPADGVTINSLIVDYKTASLPHSAGDFLYAVFYLVNSDGTLGTQLGWQVASLIPDGQWYIQNWAVSSGTLINSLRGNRVALVFQAVGDSASPALDVSVDDVTLKLCTTSTPPSGQIDGQVTQIGSTGSLRDAFILLTYHDGSALEVVDYTYPSSTGNYSFDTIAPLPAGGEYQVWFMNNTYTNTRMTVWAGPRTATFTAGASWNVPTFDIGDTALVSPAHESEVVFPVSFEWEGRDVAGDSYYWCMYDSSSRLSYDTVCTGAPITGKRYFSTDVPKTISSGPPNVVTSTLTIPSGGTIADLNLINLHGTHTSINDLSFTLQSPAGTMVQVMAQTCQNEDNFNINLNDEAAAGVWPCPPNDGGRYRPSNPLAAFDGENSTGTWILTVIDHANGDGGSLNGWGLEINNSVTFNASSFNSVPGFLRYGHRYAWFLTVVGPNYDGIQDIGYAFYSNAINFRPTPPPTFTGPAPSGSAPSNSEARDWLLMIYLAGDNNLGDPARTGEKSLMSNHFEILKQISPFYDNVHVVTLSDFYDNNGTELCYLSEETPVCQQLGEKDTANPQTLTDFINTASANFPNVTRRALVISDHGHSIAGVAMDETTKHLLATTNTDAFVMNPDELTTALGNAGLFNLSNPGLDLLYLNNCLMGSLEMAYNAWGYAKYMVASPNEVWVIDVYSGLLPLLNNGLSSRNLATGIVNAYPAAVAEHAPGYAISIAAYDLAKTGPVNAAVSNLAATLRDNIAYRRENLAAIRASSDYSNTNNAQMYDSSGDYEITASDAFVDVRDLAALLSNPALMPSPAVNTQAGAVLSALGPVGGATSFVIASQQVSGGNGRGGFNNLTYAHGLALYFPDRHAGTQATFNNLYFVKDLYDGYNAQTSWDDFAWLYIDGLLGDPDTNVSGSHNSVSGGPVNIQSGAIPLDGAVFYQLYLPLVRR